MRRNEKGFSLIEVVMAMAILGIISVAFLSGLATASKTIIMADERATAESLARSQMEYVKEQDYSVAGTYGKIDLTAYPSYDIDLVVEALAGGVLSGIQKITVTVDHHSETITILENYKVDR